MSAFIVSKQHIDALVAVAIHGPEDSASQWHEFNWSRTVESFQPYPEHCPEYWTDVAWFSLATAGMAELIKSKTEIAADEFGFLLWAENVASVRYRYPNDETDELPGAYAADGRLEVSHGYTYSKPSGRRMTAVEALKAISCLSYQSCEHPAWKESEAFRILEALKDNLIGCLAGYSAAPWEWSVTA